MKPQKVLRGSRISIPQEALDKLDLKIGDMVLINIKNDRIEVIPAEVIPR